MIFWRDVREVGVAFLLTCISRWGCGHHDWTSELLVGFACFGVGAFMLVDRWCSAGNGRRTNDAAQGLHGSFIASRSITRFGF